MIEKELYDSLIKNNTLILDKKYYSVADVYILREYLLSKKSNC